LALELGLTPEVRAITIRQRAGGPGVGHALTAQTINRVLLDHEETRSNGWSERLCIRMCEEC